MCFDCRNSSPARKTDDVASKRLQVGLGVFHLHIRYFPYNETHTSGFLTRCLCNQASGRLPQVDQLESLAKNLVNSTCQSYFIGGGTSDLFEI